MSAIKNYTKQNKAWEITKSFIKSYFTNLFIIWEIILLISHICKDVPLVDSFRFLLVSNHGYDVVLYPLTVTAIYYDVAMLEKNQEFFSQIRYNRLIRYSIVAILLGLISTDFILFPVGIIEILVDKFPEGVSNQKQYDSGTTSAALMIYTIIPIFHFIFLQWLKQRYRLETEFEHNRFKINLTRGVFIICMIFSLTLIVTATQYCQSSPKHC